MNVLCTFNSACLSTGVNTWYHSAFSKIMLQRKYLKAVFSCPVLRFTTFELNTQVYGQVLRKYRRNKLADFPLKVPWNKNLHKSINIFQYWVNVENLKISSLKLFEKFNYHNLVEAVIYCWHIESNTNSTRTYFRK